VPTRPLFPTVGLQTPGEIVEVNFGQKRFVFDFESHVQSLRQKTLKQVSGFPVNDSNGHFQVMLRKIISGYLEHEGYTETAASFAKATGSGDLKMTESEKSRNSRRKLQSMILEGRISDAIDQIDEDFPNLLETNHEIHFELKYRQMLEIMAGTEGEISKYAENSSDSSLGICGGKNAAVEDFITKGRELNEFVHALPSEFQQAKLEQIRKASELLIDKDPLHGTNADLFAESHREQVASGLSAAILSSQSLPSQPTLALLVNQTRRLHNTMVTKGVPQAAFTQPEQFF